MVLKWSVYLVIPSLIICTLQNLAVNQLHLEKQNAFSGQLMLFTHRRQPTRLSRSVSGLHQLRASKRTDIYSVEHHTDSTTQTASALYLTWPEHQGLLPWEVKVTNTEKSWAH